MQVPSDSIPMLALQHMHLIEGYSLRSLSFLFWRLLIGACAEVQTASRFLWLYFAIHESVSQPIHQQLKHKLMQNFFT